ncbi:ATP-binding protein [Streptomyces omiyaensis]|uniref:ATP-binding protein n=1 Tax=Streptomyces omiyaensis TaxID=68247 RepID=A0ABW7BTK7_9ACTN|nr:ATP-binding protein [Streptomyces omiyaensis]GGY40070.1 ATPase [Streptomyces omiyaensis]
MTGPPAVRDDGMAEGDGTPAQIRRLPLRESAGAVSRCRDFTARALADWGWTPAVSPRARERVEDVLLLVSEVVTNACLHGGGPEEFVLRHADGLLRVEVADRSSAHPRRMAPRSPALPGGHGLMVLDRLATDWGSVDRGPGVEGKVVWLEVSLPSRPPWHRRPADPP